MPSLSLEVNKAAEWHFQHEVLAHRDAAASNGRELGREIWMTSVGHCATPECRRQAISRLQTMHWPPSGPRVSVMTIRCIPVCPAA